MKPNDKIKASMYGINWDDDGEGGLPSFVEREYLAANFTDALIYDPSTGEFTFDEDIARDWIADLLADEFGFCVNYIEVVKFSY